MEPPLDMAQPAEMPKTDTDPSVSTKPPPLQLKGHHCRVVKWSRGMFYSPARQLNLYDLWLSGITDGGVCAA